MSFVLLFTLASTSVFADNSPTDSLHEFQKIKTTTQKIPQKNGGTLEITRTEYKGTEQDLKNLIEKMNNEGHSIISLDSQNSDTITTQALFNSGHLRGSGCDHNTADGVWMCAYPDFKVAARAGGLGGLAVWGNNLSTITKDTGSAATNLSSKPRIQVIGYGITGKDSFFVGTYDYSAPNADTLVDWDFDIITSGIIAYAEFYAGADFSYKYYGASKSKTVWIPMEEVN